jgi:hypothetical protein
MLKRIFKAIKDVVWPEIKYETITREQIELLRKRSPGWAAAFEPMVDQPMPPDLVSKLWAMALEDIAFKGRRE